MNQKLGDINNQIGKYVALQCSVDDVETLQEVFRFTPLALKVKDGLFRCDEVTSDFCNIYVKKLKS